MQDNKLFIILVCINILFLLIGYILGKIANNNGVIQNKPKSFFDKESISDNQKITIDNSKVVTEIKTDNLEKKYDQLGTTTQSTENISSAINKLKNMKG
jgi:hypothetical protein